MSSFFKHFPQIDYSFFGRPQSGRTDTFGREITQKVVDLFRNVDVDDIKADETISYKLYSIIDGERPDVISQKLYGTPEYHWTFFVVNNELKCGLNNWPLSDGQLSKYVSEYYEPYFVVQTNTTFVTNSYPVFNEIGETIGTISYNEIENTFKGLDLTPDFIRVVSLPNEQRYTIHKQDNDLDQLWLKGPAGPANFSPSNFYFETFGGNAEEMAAWRLHYFEWIQKTRPGFYNTFVSQISALPPPAAPLPTLSFPGGFSTEISTAPIVGPFQLFPQFQRLTDYRIYTTAADAPHHYEDPDGNIISSYYDVTRGRYPNYTTITNYEYLNHLNTSRSQIRVVHPVFIKDFAREYRKLLID
jgi:hypothetical protein